MNRLQNLCQKINIYYLLFIMVTISPMLVLQVVRKEVFLFLQIIFVIICFFKLKKIYYMKSYLIYFIFFEPFIAAAFAQFSTMSELYQKTALNLAIMSLPLLFVIVYCDVLLKKNINILDLIIKAIKLSVIIELLWMGIQLIFYHLFGIDINKLLFVDFLHMVDNASFIRNWKWYPSGLSWHSAVLAPLFVMGIFFFKNKKVRILILIASLICGNRTTLIGVLLSLLFFFVIYIKNNKIKFHRLRIKIKSKIFTKKNLTILFVILVILIFLLAITGVNTKINEYFNMQLNKFLSHNKDASTAAHLGYYSDYFKILKTSTIPQIFFGYGTGCSGYTITSLYGRYAGEGTWAIESDIVNILVSRGIIGFIGYYYFLFYIMVKGLKYDVRYFAFIFIIIIQGFGYNIQFDYLFLIEAIMYICIKRRINLFHRIDYLNKEEGKHVRNIGDRNYI